MVLKILKHALVVVLLTLMISHAVFAGDPDIISDFVLPTNTTIVGANYFTYTRLHSLFDADPPKAFTVSKATKVEYPALDGQSVSYAVLQFPSGAVNPPHTHPLGAELLFLVKGSLQVGFVDTANKLYILKLFNLGTCLCSQQVLFTIRSVVIIQPVQSLLLKVQMLAQCRFRQLSLLLE